jgi:seryl-tRNA synthetase
MSSPTSPNESPDTILPLVENKLLILRRTVSEGFQQMHAATSTLIEKYKQENARLEDENDQLRRVARKVINHWSLFIMDIFDEKTQLADKVKALEEKLKNAQESKEKLLKQLTLLIDVNTDVSSDGEGIF